MAVVGSARRQNLAQRVFSWFVDADVQYFPALDIEKAERWIGV
ncbi:SpoIIAA family protein [Flexibacterium corallicola]|nr:STAS/SEC14 domain-containing protein [Pseudovibrio sp. M1P-2-3]